MSGKLLVTGATGLVGANLIRTLLGQGRDVRALIHEDQRSLVGLDVETVRADICEPDSLVRAMQGVQVVYHLAGSISLEMNCAPQMKAINELGTHNVVAACLKCGVHRLVHFSSIDALRQDPLSQAVNECQPLMDENHPSTTEARASPYNISKARGEREVMAGIAEGLDAIIIRPTAILGPYDFKPSYLGQALVQLASGKIPALVSGGFNWVDVRDVVTGTIRAAQVAPAGACYIFGGHWHTIREVAELVTSFSGQPAPVISVPMWMADAFSPIMQKIARFNGTKPIYTRVTLNALRSNRQVSSARAQGELDYTARPLAETIADTLTWFKENDSLPVRNTA